MTELQYNQAKVIMEELDLLRKLRKLVHSSTNIKIGDYVLSQFTLSSDAMLKIQSCIQEEIGSKIDFKETQLKKI